MHLLLRRIKVFGKFPFIRLVQILDNPKYMLHILKKNLFYKKETCDYRSRYDHYKFLDGADSLDYILKHGASLARFSDGEIGILMGAGIYPPDSNWSQKWSKGLQDQLSVVLRTSKSNILIAVDPPKVFLASRKSTHPILFDWNMWIDTRRALFNYLNNGQSYGHCHLFLQENSPEFDWNKFKAYISKRNVIVCSGNIETLSHLNLGVTTDFIECGVENAFEKKESIKAQVYGCIKQNNYIPKRVLIMLCLGPTACILVDEMCDLQVLDTGHIFEFAAKGFIESELSG